MKYFWKEYLCQILCSLKWKHYVAYSQQKKCYNVILSVPAALLKWGTAWHIPSLNLKHPRNDWCIWFSFVPLFTFARSPRENVSSNRGLNPHPRDTHLSVKKSLESTLVSVAAGFCVLSCVTKISVSSLGLGWDLIFVFRCWVLLKILLGQLSSLPWAFSGTPGVILSVE